MNASCATNVRRFPTVHKPESQHLSFATHALSPHPAQPACVLVPLPIMSTLRIRKFTCSQCLEQCHEVPSVIGPDRDKVCNDCIKAFFEHAVQSEQNWPPKWRGITLDAEDVAYRHVFDMSFLRKYRRVAQEWNTPHADRIYCRTTDPPRRPDQCGRFLGRLRDRRKCQRCEKCKWYTCLRCLESFSTSDVRGKSADIDHECDPSEEVRQRTRAFSGLLRGKHYQDCPNGQCKLRVELAEACNHMQCPSCGTHFCFLCGSEAKPRSGHWSKQGQNNCPLYSSGIYADDAEDSDSSKSEMVPGEADYLQMQEELMAEFERQDRHRVRGGVRAVQEASERPGDGSSRPSRQPLLKGSLGPPSAPAVHQRGVRERRRLTRRHRSASTQPHKRRFKHGDDDNRPRDSTHRQHNEPAEDRLEHSRMQRWVESSGSGEGHTSSHSSNLAPANFGYVTSMFAHQGRC